MGNNVTAKYLKQLKPDSIRTSFDLPQFAPQSRQSCGRLSWGQTVEAKPWSYENLAKTISQSSLRQTVYFLDTCFITAQDVPECVWSALESRHVILMPQVLKELYPGGGRPNVNLCFQEQLHAHMTKGNVPWIQLFDYMRWASPFRYALHYYTSLLLCRTTAFWERKNWFVSRNGRDPTDAELETEVQRLVKDRGFLIAKKAWQKHKASKVLTDTDEALVAAAILFAIDTGWETVILTRDADVLEQFYKCIWLIDTHYKSMLLADAYQAAPFLFQPHMMRSNWRRFRGLYDGPDDVLIELYEGVDDAILPVTSPWVNSYCFSLGGPASSLIGSKMSFLLEHDMRRMIYTKGFSFGLNTLHFGGRNCHRCVDPANIEGFGHFGAIVKDRRATFNGIGIPQVDIELVLRRCERIRYSKPYWV